MIKVEHTRTLRTFQRSGLRYETVLVTDAELVLVNTGTRALPHQLSIYNGEYFVPETDGWAMGRTLIKPILISRTEKIEVGDWVLEYLMGHPYKIIQVIKEDLDRCKINFANLSCFKILALPEHFSPQQPQDIVDGKLKEGKCLVECVKYSTAPDINVEFKEWYEIKLNPYITIYPVEEKMYTREEVWTIIRDLLISDKFNGALGNAKEWFEQNVK